MSPLRRRMISNLSRHLIVVGLLTLWFAGVACSPSEPTTPAASSAAAPTDAKSIWLKPDGSIRWPPNEGFAAKPQHVVLPPGTILDRYGYVSGTFVCPAGVPPDELSLAPGTLAKPHHVYEVLKPLAALAGKAAPWFDQPGGGEQYDLAKPVRHWLNDGYLKEIKKPRKREDLQAELADLRLPADAYSLDGGLPNEAHCLERHDDGTWRTYYSERGRRTGLQTFETEQAACENLYRMIVD
ncbi:MAG: TNT domain-containing protein [Blastopirellula sp. JB062]